MSNIICLLTQKLLKLLKKLNFLVFSELKLLYYWKNAKKKLRQAAPVSVRITIISLRQFRFQFSIMAQCDNIGTRCVYTGSWHGNIGTRHEVSDNTGNCGVGITTQMCRLTELLILKTWVFLPDLSRKEEILTSERNISAKTAEFVIDIGNLWICAEWRNIKACNKYPCAILNIQERGGQLLMNPYKYIRNIITALSNFQKRIYHCFVPIQKHDPS